MLRENNLLTTLCFAHTNEASSPNKSDNGDLTMVDERFFLLLRHLTRERKATPIAPVRTMDRRILHGLVLLLWLLGLATPQGEAFRFAHGCMRVHDDGILSTSKMRGGGGGGGGKQRGEDRQRGRFSSFIFSKEKNKSHKPPLQSKNGGNIASKHRFVLSRKWARILYSLTALNPALAVLTKTLRLFRQRMATHPHALARTYETLFFLPASSRAYPLPLEPCYAPCN